jgi:putative transposase
MKQKRHTTEEIIRILREADQGKSTEAICREHNVTTTSYYRWKVSVQQGASS